MKNVWVYQGHFFEDSEADDISTFAKKENALEFMKSEAERLTEGTEGESHFSFIDDRRIEVYRNDDGNETTFAELIVAEYTLSEYAVI